MGLERKSDNKGTVEAQRCGLTRRHNGYKVENVSVKRARVWPNQYKSEFAFSLPLNSFIYYCLLLLFSKFNLHNYLGSHFERSLGFWVKIKIEFLFKKKFVIS